MPKWEAQIGDCRAPARYEEVSAVSEFSWKWMPKWLQKWNQNGALGALEIDLFDFWASLKGDVFWCVFGTAKSRPKIEKMCLKSPQGSILVPFWEPFWEPFSWKIRDSRNLLKCNTYRTGALLSPIRAFHFSINFRSKFHVISDVASRHHFLNFFTNLMPKARFW